MGFRALVAGLLIAVTSSPAAAESARELLLSAAFTSSDKPTALGRINQALKSADAAVVRDPQDGDARLQRAVAISYRGKLMRSRSDLIAARRGFEAAVASRPRDAEAQMALAGWHLGVVIDLGPVLGRTMLGASRSVGLAALDRALALGGGRAFFPAFASFIRIQLDPKDISGARRLAETALGASAPTPMDLVMQRQATRLLTTLRSGNGKAAAAASRRLLPFGQVR